MQGQIVSGRRLDRAGAAVGSDRETDVNHALEGYYEVAIGKRAVYVRVHGMATMNNCLCVRDFIDDMLGSEHSFIIADLSDCTGMDSTFMGVLAGAATFHKEDPQPGVAVVNADKALIDLLKSVGISELVFVDSQPFTPPSVEFLRLDDRAGERERLACIRTAHQKLIAVSEENEKVFRPFLTALESDMKRCGML